MPLLPVHPESALAVLPHLQSTTAPHPGGMYINSCSFAPNRYGPTFTEEWFRVCTPLRGVAERLGHGTVGLIAAGRFEGDLVGKMKLDGTDFIYAVATDELNSSLTDRAVPSPLQVASAGVLRYLQGYDPEEDANLRDRIGAAIEQEQDNLAAALRWAKSHPFVLVN